MKSFRNDPGDACVWTPVAADVDAFLIASTIQNQELDTVIVTNDLFKNFLGSVVQGVTIDAAWVERHTVKFAFVDGVFCLPYCKSGLFSLRTLRRLI